MFKPGEIANPQGRIKNNTTELLRKALVKAGKTKNTDPFKRIAKLFYSSDKMALAILPYIAPKLRTLEISGEVNVPFRFIVERADGEPVSLPELQPPKQIDSQIVVNTVCLDKRKAINTNAKTKRKHTKRKPAATRRKNRK